MKAIAAHLLDGNLRPLSTLRDCYTAVEARARSQVIGDEVLAAAAPRMVAAMG